MPKKRKEVNVSKWSEWDRNRTIKDNRRCSKCGCLIHWRRSKTGLCNPCAVKGAKGPLGSNWKGGKKLNTGGYIEVYCPEPHHKRYFIGSTPYVKEHVIAWEKHNKKALPDGYVIHHLNGIKTDNRGENLAAVQPKNHGGWTYSQFLQKRIRELEAIIADHEK